MELFNLLNCFRMEKKVIYHILHMIILHKNYMNSES